MTGLAGRLRARWNVLRVTHPAAAQRAEDAALAARGRSGLVSEVRALRGRLMELERDHLLLAAHVAMLTEHADSGAPGADGAAAAEAARQRARLAAIAFYEERIGRLEQRRSGRNTARRTAREPRRMSVGRTSGEPHAGAR